MTIGNSKKGVSVILLNWNGEQLLRECFYNVYAELNNYPGEKELLVVDNGSSDLSLSYLRENFSGLKIIALSENKGFSKANNLAVKEAKYEHLLFLNNDLKLEADFLEQILSPFASREKLFAVSPQILRWDKETIDDGIRYGVYERGLFDFVLVKDKEKYAQSYYSTFFCGACFICRKDIFEELGGFDELYTPYAYEDLDLSYRAWKRGYEIICFPKAVAYHKREATTRSSFSKNFFISLMWRNKFIFMWKNLTYKQYLYSHLLYLPVKLVKFTFNGRILYVRGFFKALLCLFKIIKHRGQEKKRAKLSDQEVLSRSFRPV